MKRGQSPPGYMPWTHRQSERRFADLVRIGYWRVDADGSVWKTGRFGTHTREIIPITPRRAESITRDGYLYIRATMDDRKRLHGGAHRLVWQWFNGDIPDGMVVNHINGVKSDNRPENLEVVTSSENGAHAHRTGLNSCAGERNPNVRLTDKQVVEIRERSAAGEALVPLAAAFGVGKGCISGIAIGRTRKSAGGPIRERHPFQPRSRWSP